MSDCDNRKAIDCIAPRPMPTYEVAARHREYMRAIQPLIERKADVMDMSPMVIVIESDGSMRSEYRLNEVQVKSIEAINSMISMVRNSYFGD